MLWEDTTMREVGFSTERLDHLGIVAGICREIELIPQIDGLVGPTDRKVTVGEATQAMVVNALGFVGRALYLTPEFFRNKPMDLLIREGLKAEDLNDDTLGRALDRLYEQGVTEVFAHVASHALAHYGIESGFYHLDSTSVSFCGEYEEEGYGGIEITHGYSKDKRPDLKQAVVSLICTYQSSLPVWLEVLDGNRSDKKSFPKTIQAYVEQMKGEEGPYFIVDSALYTAENVRALSGVKWVTRVPDSLTEVKEVEHTEVEDLTAAAQPGYAYKEFEREYGGVRQRWVLVFSQKAYDRAKKGIQQLISQERERGRKQLWHLSHREFGAPGEAEKAVGELQKKLKYHSVEFGLEQVKHYIGRGRPKATDEAKVGWKVVGEVAEAEEKIKADLAKKGKFVLATNELEVEKLSSQQVLEAYKAQGASVERGFRFLKDPLFFAEGLFLQRPERIMALLMVMGLALLVYALAERKVREELTRKGESIPNQVGKPTQRPTLRRIFQVFEGIDVLVGNRQPGTPRVVLNLRPIHLKLLHLLGPEVQKCYFLEG
jgi:transposase